MPYLLPDHKHRFASWAASRAASVKGCRFKVERGQTILVQAGLRTLIDSPDLLPESGEIDAMHSRWRDAVMVAAQDQGLVFTHGVAAKLINVYMKAAFVCGGHGLHPNVCALHPPIDKVLLEGLIEKNYGDRGIRWRYYANLRWSKFDSQTYEDAIADLREVLPAGSPFWAIEEHWQGYQ